MKKMLVALLVMLVASLAHADVIASWDVSGVDVDAGTGIDEAVSPYRFTSPNLATGIGDAKFSLGTVNPSTSADQYGFKVSTTETSLAAAIAANHYFQVSVTIANGYQLSLSNIEMNGQVTATGCDDVAFMSSIAGYTSGNELQTLTARQASGTGGLDTDSSGWGAPIDLTASAYQNLTGTVSFRIYGWNSAGGTGVNYVRNMSGADFTINGTVAAIPEPATLGFMGLGMVALFFARRRIRK